MAEVRCVRDTSFILLLRLALIRLRFAIGSVTVIYVGLLLLVVILLEPVTTFKLF